MCTVLAVALMAVMVAATGEEAAVAVEAVAVVVVAMAAAMASGVVAMAAVEVEVVGLEVEMAVVEMVAVTVEGEMAVAPVVERAGLGVRAAAMVEEVVVVGMEGAMVAEAMVGAMVVEMGAEEPEEAALAAAGMEAVQSTRPSARCQPLSPPTFLGTRHPALISRSRDSELPLWGGSSAAVSLNGISESLPMELQLPAWSAETPRSCRCHTCYSSEALGKHCLDLLYCIGPCRSQREC